MGELAVFDTGSPIYTQIMLRIRTDIISGRLKPGGRLPAVRELALEFGVNPNTMQRAFAELEREGLVHSERTAGRFITEDTEFIERQRDMLAEEKTKKFLTSMKDLGLTDGQILQALKTVIEEDAG